MGSKMEPGSYRIDRLLVHAEEGVRDGLEDRLDNNHVLAVEEMDIVVPGVDCPVQHQPRLSRLQPQLHAIQYCLWQPVLHLLVFDNGAKRDVRVRIMQIHAWRVTEREMGTQ